MPAECPTCHSALNPTDTVCNVCLRGRSRQEIFRSMREATQEEKAAKRRPFKIAGALLLAAGAALGGYWYQKNLPAPAPEPAAAAAPAATAPAAPAQAPVVPAASKPQAAPAQPAAPDYSTALPEKYRRKEKGGSSYAPSNAEEAEEGKWIVHGKVYELLTLGAVAGARLVFTDKNSGRTFKTLTKAGGAYKVSLPRVEEGGYAVAVSHKDHQAGYLDEMEPAYSQQSRPRRLEAAQMLGQSVLHVPLLPPEKGDSLEYNIILLAR